MPLARISSRRTNVALLALLPIAALTGTLAFALGTPAVAPAVVIAHGIAGVGVLVLSPWKSMIVRRGLRRARSGWPVSLLLGLMVSVTVATGLAHAGGLVRLPLAVTTMQVHVGAALLALPLATWHAIARPSRPRRTDLSRRALLRTAGMAGGAGLLWLGTEAGWALGGTRGTERRFTGSHERGSLDPARMPVTQWMFDRVPQIPAEPWRLRVVPAASAVSYRFVDLPYGDRVRATLDCTGGWYAEQDWSGVRLDRLIGEAGAFADAGVMGGAGEARSVLVRSVTGYARRFPVSDLPRLWLATRCGGRPLTRGHGAPARLVAPGRRGFWWVKWVNLVAVDDVPAWRQPPFPLQ